MCRGIETLHPPFAADVGPADLEAAAPRYVRKIFGFR
jgi:hypothetical protein